jgi:uncharacterized protein (TIGR02145 family)
MAAFCLFGYAPDSSSEFTDARGGRRYRTVKMPDGKTWMAENLNYETPYGSWCYEDSGSYCDKYGRLYNWTAARKACPAGWHLPSRKEWNRLSVAADGVREKRYTHWACLFPLFAKNYRWVWGVAGRTLKSRSGWNEDGYGTDAFRFSALPGGYRYGYNLYSSNERRFNNAGYNGYWWTSTGRRRCCAYMLSMSSGGGVLSHEDAGGDLDDDYRGKDNGYSVRCVTDD